MEAIIWLVTYKGQTESVYTWTATYFEQARELMKELENEFPNREWDVEQIEEQLQNGYTL
jgi:hypothetical protein